MQEEDSPVDYDVEEKSVDVDYYGGVIAEDAARGEEGGHHVVS